MALRVRAMKLQQIRALPERHRGRDRFRGTLAVIDQASVNQAKKHTL